MRARKSIRISLPFNARGIVCNAEFHAMMDCQNIILLNFLNSASRLRSPPFQYDHSTEQRCCSSVEEQFLILIDEISAGGQ